MEIIYKKLTEIKPYKRNPRNNEPAIEAVANSIKEFGFKVPIVIDKNGEIVAGHTRYKASQKLGLTEVPCIVADDLNEEQIKAFRLADNKTAELATWDEELLALELADIKIDMGDFGFEPIVPDDEEPIEDNFDVDDNLPEEPKSKLGDIYQLGNHRLMCGDSTKEKDVAKLMGGAIADLVVTDPPYNVAIVGGSHALSPEERKRQGGKSIQNDEMSDEEFDNFLTKAFKNMTNSMKNGGVFYIYHASWSQREFENALNNANLQVREQLIWNKNSMTFGRSDYQWKHEPIFYGWKDGAAHYFTDDRTQTTVIEDKGIDLKKLKKEEMLKLLQEIYSDKISTTIINENKPSISEEHPTMKPIKLLARHIKNSSRINESVLDLFGGSGSTLIACEQLHRKCYLMEFDPQYVDVIIKRWEEFTGKTAVKIG